MRHALDMLQPETPTGPAQGRPLNRADAIEIWIARWLRVSRKDLVARYGCDPRRLYDIWWGLKFPGSREEAARVFADRHPGLVDRTVFGYRKIARPTTMSGQLDLFAPPLLRQDVENQIVEHTQNKDGQIV